MYQTQRMLCGLIGLKWLEMQCKLHSRFHQFLGPGCINLKNLCAHHQEEILTIPKHPQLAKLGWFLTKLWQFKENKSFPKIKWYSINIEITSKSSIFSKHCFSRPSYSRKTRVQFLMNLSVTSSKAWMQKLGKSCLGTVRSSSQAWAFLRKKCQVNYINTVCERSSAKSIPLKYFTLLTSNGPSVFCLPLVGTRFTSGSGGRSSRGGSTFCSCCKEVF